MRKILGQALGRCPRQKIFKTYAQIELQLYEFDRCRKIYTKQLEVFPHSSNVWVDYAEFEASLEELERAREIYELAIRQTQIDLPERVW
jgi:crooked neck